MIIVRRLRSSDERPGRGESTALSSNVRTILIIVTGRTVTMLYAITRKVQYVDAYRHYGWQVETVAYLKLAPFHILATERAVHIDKNYLGHMQTAEGNICELYMR